MARRLAFALTLVLLLAAPAAADTLHERKRSVDAQIASLRESLEQTRAREAAVRAEIASVSEKIQALSQQVGDVSSRLPPLERELALRELKLNRLNELYRFQTQRLRFLRRQYRLALQRLNERLVAIYEEEQPDTLSVLLSARSLADLLDALDYAQRIGEQDKRISEEVAVARAEAQAARARTGQTRVRVEQEARVIAVRVSQVRSLRDRLVASRDELADARAAKRARLADLTESEREALSEIEALARVSAELAARIRAAQAASASSSRPVVRSASGFVWPVGGPITSAFGWRWGRMHEGIDIGAPYGAPIAAALAGRVIYAGWLGGYGNLVVLDHGGGLATAYAHQSRIAVSTGQDVAQGQTIGYVGSTGHSFGAHLHFEVRVNGAAVDPLGYL